jgi:hypothetical protein
MPNQVVALTQNDTSSVANFASGSITGDAGTPVAYQLPLGFQARRFKLTQIVGTGSPITWEWSDGMGANSVKSIAAGTQTVDATGFVIGDRGITIPASVLLASATYVYEAQG